MKVKEALMIFLRGVFMGMADVIPGVSGGTVALITGIYERLIFAIKGINLRFLADVFRRDFRKAGEEFLKMDWQLLVPLVIGIGTAFLIFSRVIKFMLEAYPANTYAFFFGLILASAGFVYKQVSGIDYRTISAAVIGFVFAFLLVGLQTLQTVHDLPVIFFSGMIAIVAMVLPGISGAFILFFLGQYEFMLSALLNMEGPSITAFLLGALVGLFTIVKVMGYLLKRHKSVTMAGLVGLMLGALRLPYQNVVASSYSMPFVLLAGLVGILAVVLLEKLGSGAGGKGPA